MTTLGERIRSRRIELGLTQAELAAKVGYTNKSTIGKIENGNMDITQSKVVQLANALETTVAYVMGWEEEERLHEFEKQVNDLLDQMTDEQKTMFLSLGRALIDASNPRT